MNVGRLLLRIVGVVLGLPMIAFAIWYLVPMFLDPVVILGVIIGGGIVVMAILGAWIWQRTAGQ